MPRPATRIPRERAKITSPFLKLFKAVAISSPADGVSERRADPELLAGLGDETAHVRLIAEVCLARGARWGEAEGLQSRQVRHGLIHYSKTKSSKNRSVPIDTELQKRLTAPLPFKSSYSKFRDAVEAIGLELPDGQLTHVLRHTLPATT